MKTDLSYLRNMSGNDQSLILEMIDIFIIQVREIENDMKRFLSTNDYDSLGKIAHKAKSSVAILGMNLLSKKMKELEILAMKKSKPDRYPGLVELFISETREAIRELTEYRHKKTVSS